MARKIIKPKYKLGQKILLANRNYWDHKNDTGYICGIEIRRSYNSAGLFQSGGLSTLKIERKGYIETWLDSCDEVVYKVIYTIHTTGSTATKNDVSECDIIPYTEEE